MPNIKSAKKELRKSKKRHEYNLKIKENLKALLKKSRKAIEINDPKAEELVKQTIKALDKSAQKDIIKRNNSDRNKSRLQTKLNKISKKK
jgi:small subunit ribosomal protein S20